MDKKDNGRRRVRNKENVEAVRKLLEERPQISVRYVQQKLNFCYGTCRRIFKYDSYFHSYRLQATHKILPLDRTKQQNFCQQFIYGGGIDKLMGTD